MGNRDAVPKLPIKEDGVDYVLFTDRQPKQCPGWEVRSVPEVGSDRQKAKYHKMFFPEGYDWVVYMDARFTPKVKLRAVAENFTSNSPWTVFKHPWNSCIHQEASNCVRSGLADSGDVKKWLAKLTSEGYPRRAGLAASGVSFRKDTPKVREMCKLWWECVLQVEGERDQLSFDYACWKTGLKYAPINLNIYHENKWFSVHPHTSSILGRLK